MSRLATSFVLGYHGCDKDTAEKVISGRASLTFSDKPYDWLGPGIYFWEADEQRAREWAERRCAGTGKQPAVIGAALDLRNCLDLVSRADQDIVRQAYDSLSKIFCTAKQTLPTNENSKSGGDFDRRLRKLDCAVIKHLHELADDKTDDTFDPFDSVRGMFTEGDEVYPGSGFHSQSHVQISIRNRECIKGLFYPPNSSQRAVDKADVKTENL